MDAGSQIAASSRMSPVLSPTSVLAPPMTPAIEMTPLSSAITMSSASSTRTVSSSVVSFSPDFARRTTRLPWSFEASNACSGCPSSIIT